MRILIKEKLSEHKSKTPEGYLICQDAILARTGIQEYLKSEIYEDFDGEDSIVQVERKPEQVFSAETLSSFEDKPITVEHPDESVGPDNYSELAVGHTRNIRKGKFNGQDVMIGDLVITDAQTIEDIENGIRTELSCGYDCDITEGDHPEQINIRGNHVALCEQGRAGIAKIIDHGLIDIKPKKGESKEEFIARFMEETKEEYPDEKQRAAIAYSYWDKRDVNDSKNLESLKKYFASISKHMSNDIEISDIIEPISKMGFAPVREKIDGWNKTEDGLYRKDYYFSLDGLKDMFIVSLYADAENGFKVNEVNAYFIGKKHENDSIDNNNDIKLEHVIAECDGGSYEDGVEFTVISAVNNVGNTYKITLKYEASSVEMDEDPDGNKLGYVVEDDPDVIKFFDEESGKELNEKELRKLLNIDEAEFNQLMKEAIEVSNKLANETINEYMSKNTMEDSVKDSNLGNTLLKVGQIVHLDPKYVSIKEENKEYLNDEYEVKGFWRNGKIVEEDFTSEFAEEHPDVVNFSGIALINLRTGKNYDLNRFQLMDGHLSENNDQHDSVPCKLGKDSKNKYVIYNENGIFKGTPLDNYNAQSRDADKITSYKGFESLEQVVNYLLKYTELNREDIMTIGDGVADVKVLDDYPQRFYKKAVKSLEGKLKKIIKVNNDEVRDENEYEYNRQKFSLVKEIKKQLEEYKDKIVKDSVVNLRTNIKEWYCNNYPEDKAGKILKDGVTFYDLFECLDNYNDVYKLLGINDPIIRERCFAQLADLMEVDYEYIYDQWMKE